MGNSSSSSDFLHFVIVPKNVDGAFFDQSGQGCVDRAKQLGNNVNNVQCHYIGALDADALEQAKIIKELITNPTNYNLTKIPNGISVSVLDENITGEAINFVHNAGVPVITYDSDAPNSKREVFVGTDNYAFGVQLGSVLNKLNPVGKNYGIITALGPNLQKRMDGVCDRLEHDWLHPTNWKQVSYSPLNCLENGTLAIELMEQYANDPNVDAIIILGGWPMYGLPNLWKEFTDSNPHVFTVVADTTDQQIDLMNKGYVNGLVGQMPYQMGRYSAEQLFRINEAKIQTLDETQITPLLDVLRVPDALPSLTTNHNYIGNLAILGYVLFGIVFISSISISVFVYLNQKNTIIRASQPAFLQMICVGTLILGSSIIMLTFDDENGSQVQANIGCMAFPWLLSIGFITAFSALFSKTCRIYRIMKSAKRFQRIKIRRREVLIPYMVLMTINVINLLCWTILAPLTYVRQPALGTDDWNRAMATYGTCESQNGKSTVPYETIMLCSNGIVLIISNFIAYRSRDIKSEYAESRYIAFIMSSVLQISAIGVPIVFLIHQHPRADFIVKALLIFIICMDILCFIFIPKIIAMRMKKDGKHKRNLNSDVVYGGKRYDTKKNGAPDVVIDDTMEPFTKIIEELSLNDKQTMHQFLLAFSSLNEDGRKGFIDKKFDPN